jgi:hypothetical protein
MTSMINQHPITPPSELVEQWASEKCYDERDWLYELHIATRAAQWGADQELEACCEWFQEFYKTESWVKHDLKHFRTARRPKSSSLKEQALAIMAKKSWSIEEEEIIRRALEALPE